MSQVARQSATTLEPGESDLREWVSDALARARRKGASAAEASASYEAGLEASVRLGEVETVEFHRDRGLGITVYFGKRKGSASTTDLTPQALEEAVTAACDIARYTAEDDCAGLADAELMAKEIPDLDLFHPWDPPAEDAIDIALRCEARARALDPRIENSEGASVSSHRGLRCYGNTHGFLGSVARTRHAVSCTVIAGGNGGMQRDYWYTVARDAADLEDAEAVGERAARRALARLGARRLPTRKVPVVYQAEVAASLLSHFVRAISGGALYRKASFLLDHVGKPVFPEWVRIHEEPHLRKALGSAAFDEEGVATRARDLIQGGVLQGYVLDSYSARKLGLQTTGNAGGVHNLIIDPPPGDAISFDALLERMGTGLLVTELMGFGVNIVTGDYSRGCSGFWVENGEIAYPVQEITVAGNLREIFMGVEAVADDIDLRGNIRTGSLLIRQMTVAGS